MYENLLAKLLLKEMRESSNVVSSVGERKED